MARHLELSKWRANVFGGVGEASKPTPPNDVKVCYSRFGSWKCPAVKPWRGVQTTGSYSLYTSLRGSPEGALRPQAGVKPL